MTLDERIFCYRWFSEFCRGTFPQTLEKTWPVVSQALELSGNDFVLDTALREQWAIVFFGVGEHTVSLTESAWTHPLGWQNQEPALHAHQSYLLAGVEPKGDDDHLFDDHLSVLLGFMGWALQKDHDASAFFDKHFGPWISVAVQYINTQCHHASAQLGFEALLRFLALEKALYSSQP